MGVALRFERVTRRFGRRVALDGLDLRCPTGALAGLIGPNGAGKTTAFSLVGGFLQPHAGRVEILGQDGFDPWRLKGRLGVLPQDAELPDRHPARALLRHLARLQGLPDPARAAEQALAQVQLTDRAGEPVGNLSHGIRRRVAVATALLGSPELVLLDEPMSGLDPLQAQSLREVLAGLRGRTTLLVSSHDLNEVERLCDWVAMIAAGRCVREGTLAEVTGRAEVSVWHLGADLPADALQAAIGLGAARLSGREIELRAESEAGLDAAGVALMALRAARGVPIREVRRGAGLERRFLEAAHSEQ
jgi:ABC-type multidrug transport system ATPase subunit